MDIHFKIAATTIFELIEVVEVHSTCGMYLLKPKNITWNYVGGLFGNCACYTHFGCSVVGCMVADSSLLPSVKYVTVQQPSHFHA